jgi:hypothetical protein
MFKIAFFLATGESEVGNIFQGRDRAPFFLGKSPKKFCPNDGFVNTLNKNGLDNPTGYLMIPYNYLPEKPVKKVKVWSGSGYYIENVPDYNQETVYDYNPGWRAWARGEYGGKWEKLMEIQSKTGPDFKW